jgi:hypothetical protein
MVLWGPDNWYHQRAVGKCSYVTPPPTPMPMMPERYSLLGVFEGPPYPSDSWHNLTRQESVIDTVSGKLRLPIRPWVYPAPGYLRLIYRAHADAGLSDSLLVRHQSLPIAVPAVALMTLSSRTQHC